MIVARPHRGGALLHLHIELLDASMSVKEECMVWKQISIGLEFAAEDCSSGCYRTQVSLVQIWTEAVRRSV